MERALALVIVWLWSGHATAVAKHCIAAHPEAYRSVWGSALQLDRAVATRVRDREWRVWFPEAEPKGKPAGLDVEIDMSAGTCRSAPME
jgi:hypothetical protein